ncbi:disease resistance protein RGA2-like [Rutidosis leptorrhynchoides]|uniref:disease resistance protein RGA2-like n=1 Tax=Rutidosis leptorrhynchoides TaxID=125765 RepID=UPI003A99C2EF
MAEVIASDLIKLVLQNLASEVVKKIAGSRGIQYEINKFDTIFSDILELLNDASQKEVTDKDVKRWLNRLQHLAYGMEDVLDGLATDAMHREFNDKSVGSTSKVKFPSWLTNFSLSIHMGNKLDQIYKELKDLETGKD